jgi:hypothetical protein
MYMVNTYTMCIINPYICFNKPLSSLRVHSKGLQELGIHLHVESITHLKFKTYKFIVIVHEI